MPFLFGLETLAIVALKAAFGKAAVGAVAKTVVGAAIKTGVGVAAKAAVVHDVVQVFDAVSDASTAVDVASTASNISDTSDAVLTCTPSPDDVIVGDCGGVAGAGAVVATVPLAIPDPTGVIIDPVDPTGPIGGSGETEIPVHFVGGDSVIALGHTGVDADIDIHGNNPENDVQGNRPSDIHGNNPKNNVHGNGPGNVYGPWFK